MTKKESYESRVEAYLLPLMEENNFELVDVEYVKEAGTWYLRAYIDKEGGIAVDDCEVISRKLSDWLDKEDFIDDSYILEVSSPGLGRPLKKYLRSVLFLPCALLLFLLLQGRKASFHLLLKQST